MKRRNFVRNIGLGSAVAALAGGTSLSSFAKSNAAGKPFNLDYAPHFGMFKAHAGDGLVSQLEFMADQGFRSLEDNGLLGRPVEDQNLIGKTLERLNMRMGVFVVDGGDNWKISLASGKQEFIDNFVATCKKSVEASKRVRIQMSQALLDLDRPRLIQKFSFRICGLVHFTTKYGTQVVFSLLSIVASHSRRRFVNH